MNSLQNRRQILVDYAKQNGYEVIGDSFDGNVSGVTFDRKGSNKLENAVDEGKVGAVLVKDLSRSGRYRTQTALFIDRLRKNNVKVISVAEGIDTTNENDDLPIGFKQIFNDFYAKDIGKKVRAGICQKQKTGPVVNLSRSECYNSMIEKREKEIAEPEQKISDSQQYNEVSRQKSDSLKSASELLSEKISSGYVSDANLRMLIKQVKVFNDDDGGIDVVPEFNGVFNHC